MPRLADTARAYAALARWLGPWAAEDLDAQELATLARILRAFVDGAMAAD